MSLELNIFQNLKYNGQAFNNENLPIVYIPFSFEGKISFYCAQHYFPSNYGYFPLLASLPFGGRKPT
jgi:hypothetical protein